MRIIALVTALVMGLFASQSVAAQSVDVDLEAPDGVTLKATYHSPGRPGKRHGVKTPPQKANQAKQYGNLQENGLVVPRCA